MSEIADGKVVVIEYILKNAAGELLDTSVGRAPLAYLHGRGNLIAGLERALVGKQAGDKVEVELAAEDAYGAKRDVVERVHRRDLPRKDLTVGDSFAVQAGNGTSVQLFVQKIEGAWYWVTPDHPLAGQALRFDVWIRGVRDATAEEAEHGHAHGPEGFEHQH